jgi:hypothetical protein
MKMVSVFALLACMRILLQTVVAFKHVSCAGVVLGVFLTRRSINVESLLLQDAGLFPGP